MKRLSMALVLLGLVPGAARAQDKKAPVAPQQQAQGQAQTAPAGSERAPPPAAAAPTSPAQGETTANPCGSVKFENGAIALGKALPVDSTLSADTEACVTEIGRQVMATPSIRGVTVVAKVTDADRGAGKGLAAAQAAVERLVAQGVPRARTSAVSPRVDDGEATGLFFTYAEAPYERGVAIVLRASDATAGRMPDAQKPLAQGSEVRVFDVVKTGSNGSALVKLADGSTLLLGNDANLRIASMGLNTALKRQVQLELNGGSAQFDVSKGGEGSVFEIATLQGTVRAVGTKFRVETNKDATEVESLEGTVAVSAGGNEQELKAGQGARATAEKVEAAAGLPGAPTVSSPVLGTFNAPPQLTWGAAEGAKSYVVELAKNADFDDGLLRRTSDTTSLTPTVPEGKWFWRVVSVDSSGLEGGASKTYAFTFDRKYQPPPAPPKNLPGAAAK